MILGEQLVPSTPPAVRHLLQEQKGVRTAKEAAALLWEDKEDQDQCCLRCAKQDERPKRH
jgi:hypothetical protein